MDQQDEEFQEKLKAIQGCRTIDEFISMYDIGGLVRGCLDRLRDAQRGSDPETWAKEWAMDLNKRDKEAQALNGDRKLSLELFYTLCKRWKGEDELKTLSESDIVDRFKARRVMGILGPCLFMDRANALYNMTLPGKQERGMHWVSKSHVERDPAWKARMEDCGGRPTMNKRYLWLMEDPALEGLELRKDQFMQKLTTPVEAPWSRPAGSQRNVVGELADARATVQVAEHHLQQEPELEVPRGKTDSMSYIPSDPSEKLVEKAKPYGYSGPKRDVGPGDAAAGKVASTKKKQKGAGGWTLSSLETLPKSHLVKTRTRSIGLKDFNHTHQRLSNCFRVMSIQAKFSEQSVSAALLTPENVQLLLALWLSTDGESIILELFRRSGDWDIFHGYCNHILDAFSGNFEKPKRTDEEEGLLQRLSLGDRLEAEHPPKEDIDHKPVLSLRVAKFDNTELFSQEGGLTYLQLEDKLGIGEDVREESFLALKAVCDLFRTQNRDSRCFGMVQMSNLVDARKTVLWTATLMSRALMVPDERPSVSQELHDIFLDVFQQGAAAEDSWTSESLKVDDYFPVPVYKEESQLLFNLALLTLARTLEVALTFGVDAEEHSVPVASVVDNFLAEAQATRKIDLLQILLQTLQRAHLKLHNAWFAARCLRFSCKASPDALQKTRELGGIDIVEEACCVGILYHRSLEAECRMLQKELAMKVSLWIMPPESVRSSLYDQIVKLADYDGTHPFEPHISVVGGIPCHPPEKLDEWRRKLKEGLDGLGPVPCRFDKKVQWFGPKWNQEALCFMERSDEYLHLMERSRELLGVQDKPRFEPIVCEPPHYSCEPPHYSFFYGEKPPSPENEIEIPPNFEAVQVALWKTDPSTVEGITEWEELARFSLC